MRILEDRLVLALARVRHNLTSLDLAQVAASAAQEHTYKHANMLLLLE